MKGLVMVVFLAACPLQKGVNFSGPASQPTAASSPASEPSEESAGQSGLDAKNFLRAEFESLAGLTIDAAKAKAKARGHLGEVRVVEEDYYREDCKANTVCKGTDAGGGMSGMGNKDMLILWTNKTVTISGPPE